jgi:hypothetical protein
MPIALPLGFYAVINESGTSVEKGYLWVRVDIYSPVGSKTYPLYHVQLISYPEPDAPLQGYPGKMTYIESHLEYNPVDDRMEQVPSMWLPDDKADYDTWLAGLSRIWQLNPILGYFIAINPETTKEELEALILRNFDINTLQQLDTFQGDQKQPDRIRLGKVGQLMNTPTKRGPGRELRLSIEAQASLINQINTSMMEVIV